MRPIDLDAFLKRIRSSRTLPVFTYDYSEKDKAFVSLLNELAQEPTIDVVPVVHGCWYFVNYYAGRCSNCGHIVKTDLAFHPNYCEECGCKMDRIQEKKEDSYENDNC